MSTANEPFRIGSFGSDKGHPGGMSLSSPASKRVLYPIPVNTGVIPEGGSAGNNNRIPIPISPVPSSTGRTLGQKGPTTSWQSINSMPPQMSAIAIDPAIWEDTKTEDIERHKKDENLDAFQIAMLCLSSKDVSQKIYSARSLPSMAKLNAQRTFQEILPAIESDLKRVHDIEFHSAVASSIVPLFREVMKARNSKCVKQLLGFLSNTIDYDDPDLVRVWLSSIEDVTDLMSPKDAIVQILPLVEDKAKQTKVLPKNIAIALLRKLLTNSQGLPDSARVAQTGESIAHSLVVDPSPEVRAAVTNLFMDLIKLAWKSGKANPELVHKLIALLDDPDKLVRIQALEAVCQLVAESSSGNGVVEGSTLQQFIDVLKKSVRNAYSSHPSDVQFLVHFTKHIGSLVKVAGGKYPLKNVDKFWFLDTFVQLSVFTLKVSSGKEEIPPGFASFKNTLGANQQSLDESLLQRTKSVKALKSANAPAGGANPASNIVNGEVIEAWMVRANCASNFNDILTFGKPLVDFKNGLYVVFRDFFFDPHPDVRRNIVAALDETMEILGDQSRLCVEELKKALSDENLDVLEAMIPNLSNILKLLVKHNVLSPDAHTTANADIAGFLLFCEERLSQSRDWRAHSSLLLQLVVLPFCIPNDFIFEHFSPILFHRLLHLQHLPSKLAAAEAIISMLRHCRRGAQRDEMRRKICAFTQSISSHDRMLYLFMNEMIMNRFSRKYYLKYFFEPTLRLAEDQIPNVRTKAYRQMPKMFEKARKQNETELWTKLQELIGKMHKNETDRDALEAITAAVHEMERFGMHQAGGSQAKFGTDADDKKKENEEKYLSNLEVKLGKYIPKKTAEYPGPVLMTSGKMPDDKSKAKHGQTNDAASSKSFPSRSGTDDNTSGAKLGDKPLRQVPSYPRNSRNIVPLATVADHTSSKTTVTDVAGKKLKRK